MARRRTRRRRFRESIQAVGQNRQVRKARRHTGARKTAKLASTQAQIFGQNRAQRRTQRQRRRQHRQATRQANRTVRQAARQAGRTQRSLARQARRAARGADTPIDAATLGAAGLNAMDAFDDQMDAFDDEFQDVAFNGNGGMGGITSHPFFWPVVGVAGLWFLFGRGGKKKKKKK